MRDRSRSLCNPALVSYTSGHGPEAILIDMEGRELHRWRRSFEDAFDAPEEPHANQEWWRRGSLLGQHDPD